MLYVHNQGNLEQIIYIKVMEVLDVDCVGINLVKETGFYMDDNMDIGVIYIIVIQLID